MPEFRYTARQMSGQQISGVITADSERDALQALDDRALLPVRIEAEKGSGGSKLVPAGHRIRLRQLAALYGGLADLLKSGVPLMRSLEILEHQSSRPALGEILKDVRAQVADGVSLADAMGRHPKAFSGLAVSMVRAGQEGGFLEDVLKRLGDFTEHAEDLRSKVIGALAYPVFLVTIGMTIVALLLVFLVPRFEAIFGRLRERGELPMPTIALLGFSRFLQERGIWIAGGAFVVAVVVVRLVRTPKGQLLLDGWKLRLPLAGAVVRNLAIARFSRILGTLLKNGIPILSALRIAKDSAGNRVLSQAIDAAAENISTGDTLAEPLASSGHFPREVVEMIAVGEESNNLEQVLLNVADGTERRMARQLELMVRLLEPVMLLITAVIILVVVAALLLPVFRMSTALR